MLLGCGEPPLPSASEPNAVPLAGISSGTVGVIRINLKRCTRSGIERWLDEGAANVNPFVTRALSACDGLSALGISTAVLPIPSIEFIPEELGIYLSGPEGVDRDAIEEVFLKAGGLNMPGFMAEMAFAKELGDGWYFYGWGDDGILDDVDADRARAFADELENVKAAIVTAAFITDPNTQFDLTAIPQGEARAARRLRALCAAANEIRAVVVSGGTDDGSEWRIRFTSADACDAAKDAVAKAIHDVELMYEGSNSNADMTTLDLLGWRKLSQEGVMKIEGDCIVVAPK